MVRFGQSVMSLVQLAGVVVVPPVPPSALSEAIVIDEQAGIEASELFVAFTLSVMHVEYSLTVAVAAQVLVSPMEQLPVAPASEDELLQLSTAAWQVVCAI